MFKRRKFKRHERRGATFALVSIAMLAFLGAVAAAIDFGWIALARTQLQVSADAAALAAASELSISNAAARDAAHDYVDLNQVGGPGEHGVLDNSDIVFGIWDKLAGIFSPSSTGANAVQVTVRKHLPLFFGAMYGHPYVDLEASAVGIAGPRDIAFVIDLSGSMNNDTEIWATSSINSAFPGYSTIGTNTMVNVFSDFGFGSYPGTIKHVGEGLPGAPNNDTSYTWLSNTYLLNNLAVPAQYRVLTNDSLSTRKFKTYSWIIDNQLAVLMPNAKPTPSSTTNYSYWASYLDFMIKPNGIYPPAQISYRINTGSNPYIDAWPALTSTSYSSYYNKLGYLTYMQFMMDYGRNKLVTTTRYANLSLLNSEVPMHIDNDPSSPGFGLSFPPREQPTHSVRLAVMAAINRVAELNVGRPEGAKDHVCLITFDTGSGTTVRYPLDATSCSYASVKDAVRTIQAASDDVLNTASEKGLVAAKNHLDPAINPSGARPNSKKVVIFL